MLGTSLNQLKANNMRSVLLKMLSMRPKGDDEKVKRDPIPKLRKLLLRIRQHDKY